MKESSQTVTYSLWLPIQLLLFTLQIYEDGENWISEIQTDRVYIQYYHMKRLTGRRFTPLRPCGK